MTEKELESKERIISVSRVLFAEKGFEGTTVRDIASAAEVNVASVNYYFSSKEKLFEEVMKAGHALCSSEIGRIMTEEKKLEEALVKIFRFFVERNHELISMFKLMMTTQDKHKFLPDGDKEFGPPGGQFVIEALTRVVGKETQPEDLHWALKILFSHIVHTAIMYNCCFKGGNVPFTSDEDIEKGIRRLCKVVLAELR